MSILAILRWLYGNVLGNLIASAIWAVPAFIHLHWKLNRQHRERHGPPG